MQAVKLQGPGRHAKFDGTGRHESGALICTAMEAYINYGGCIELVPGDEVLTIEDRLVMGKSRQFMVAVSVKRKGSVVRGLLFDDTQFTNCVFSENPPQFFLMQVPEGYVLRGFSDLVSV